MVKSKCVFTVLVRNDEFKELARIEYLSYSDALSKFRYFIDCTLEFGLNVRVINLIKGKKTIKLFQNH